MARAKWFRRRRFGPFVTPSTWWGWAITIGLALFLVYHAAGTGQISVLVTIMLLVVVIFMLLRFVRRRSHGRWRWSRLRR